MSEPSLPEQTRFYDRRWRKIARRPVRHQHLLNRIAAIDRLARQLALPPDASIVDVGSGLGTVAGRLSRYGNIEGIELSPEAVRIASTHYPRVRFRAGNFLDVDPPARLCDLIVSTEVLEHVPVERRGAFLGRIAEWLAPGGHLILTTPNGAVSHRVNTDQPLEHHCTEDELRDLVAPHFDVIEVSTCHAFFPVLCHRSRVLQAVRAILFAVPGARRVLEHPVLTGRRGLHLVMLARRREDRQGSAT